MCKSTPFWSIWFLCGVNLLVSETKIWDFFCEVPELGIEFLRKLFFWDFFFLFGVNSRFCGYLYWKEQRILCVIV